MSVGTQLGHKIGNTPCYRLREAAPRGFDPWGFAQITSQRSVYHSLVAIENHDFNPSCGCEPQDGYLHYSIKIIFLRSLCFGVSSS